jgi:hypothetical protein
MVSMEWLKKSALTFLLVLRRRVETFLRDRRLVGTASSLRAVTRFRMNTFVAAVSAAGGRRLWNSDRALLARAAGSWIQYGCFVWTFRRKV